MMLSLSLSCRILWMVPIYSLDSVSHNHTHTHTQRIATLSPWQQDLIGDDGTVSQDQSSSYTETHPSVFSTIFFFYSLISLNSITVNEMILCSLLYFSFLGWTISFTKVLSWLHIEINPLYAPHPPPFISFCLLPLLPPPLSSGWLCGIPTWPSTWTHAGSATRPTSSTTSWCSCSTSSVTSTPAWCSCWRSSSSSPTCPPSAAAPHGPWESKINTTVCDGLMYVCVDIKAFLSLCQGAAVQV